MTPSVERKILGEVRMLMEERTESGKTIDYQEQIQVLAGKINEQYARIEILEVATHKKEPEKDTGVKEFAARMAAGENMVAPEDMQFYENNKEEIEKCLQSKAVKKPKKRSTKKIKK